MKDFNRYLISLKNGMGWVHEIRDGCSLRPDCRMIILGKITRKTSTIPGDPVSLGEEREIITTFYLVTPEGRVINHNNYHQDETPCRDLLAKASMNSSPEFNENGIDWILRTLAPEDIAKLTEEAHFTLVADSVIQGADGYIYFHRSVYPEKRTIRFSECIFDPETAMIRPFRQHGNCVEYITSEGIRVFDNRERSKREAALPLFILLGGENTRIQKID